MTELLWNLDQDLGTIRDEFPILDRCVYLINNSLGAVPRGARADLERFYSLWAEEGVTAWSEEWWHLARKVGDRVAGVIGAGQDEVTMMPNATIGHWVALSTQFLERDKGKNKIVATDQDFPSSLYAVAGIARFMGWELDIVPSRDQRGIDVASILERIDHKTLFVTTSHVYFKSACIQDIARISDRAKEAGALTVIDGYHAPGVIPVDVRELDVDFYIGGCLKWLCGGPGNSFLYVRRELASRLQPQLTGWFAHNRPFAFSTEMEYTQGSYRFMSGTSPIPSLYTALAGLEAINRVGLPQIRRKSLALTQRLIRGAKEKGYGVFTPEEEERRGGAVSIHMPHACSVRTALEKRGIRVDFRKGKGREPDVIRVGPHFYNSEEEIDAFFHAVDEIYATKEYEQYPEKLDEVT